MRGQALSEFFELSTGAVKDALQCLPRHVRTFASGVCWGRELPLAQRSFG